MRFFTVPNLFVNSSSLAQVPLKSRGDVTLLLLKVLAYASAYETDGFAPRGVSDWSAQKERRLAALAAEAGLLEIAEYGYIMPFCDTFMPTSKAAGDKREATRQRVARHRAQKAAAQAEGKPRHVTGGVTDEESNAFVTLPEKEKEIYNPPTPLRPVEDVTSLGDETVADVEAEEAGDDQEVVMDKFEEFWQAYPRTAGENRRKAEAIWLAICSRDPALCDVIVAAARAYAASPSRPQKTSSLPAPARWLSERRFESMPEAKARARPSPKPPEEPESEVDDGLEEIREALDEGRPLPAWWAKIPASVREAFLAKLETTQQATEPKEKTA